MVIHLIFANFEGKKLIATYKIETTLQSLVLLLTHCTPLISLVDQFISFLNRFDLIFLMLDPQDEQFDRRLATHLVSLYHQSMADEEGAYLDMAVLRDYIAFARTYVHPDLSEEAGQALIQAYVGE